MFDLTGFSGALRFGKGVEDWTRSAADAGGPGSLPPSEFTDSDAAATGQVAVVSETAQNGSGTGLAVFSASDGVNGIELWVTDGTAAGTIMLKDINPGAGSSDPSGFTQLGDKLLFRSNDGLNGVELWVTDGTAAGTMLLKDINPGTGASTPADFTRLGDKLLFRATDSTNGAELWVTDGTAAGTMLLKNISPSTGSSSPIEFTQLGDKVIFRATDVTNGQELWVTDGTAAGTTLLKDIYPGSISSSPIEFTRLGDKLLFRAVDATNGSELWVTDGTAAGTMLLKDINPGTGSSTPTELARLGDKLLFAANDPTNGYELWVTDGTAAGTILLKDIRPGTGSSSPAEFTQLGDKLLFRATDSTNGQELWVTDGTAAGTMLLKDIYPGSIGSGPTGFTQLGDKLVFRASDGTAGSELWVTDGTAAGTMLLKDIRPGGSTSSPNGFTQFGDKLLFAAFDGTNGTELWVTDGTAAGTMLLKDILPGTASSNASGFTTLNPTAANEAPTFAAPTFAIERVSTTSTGAQATGNSSFATFSPDGTKIVFLSDAGNLVAGDTNNQTDVFVKDLASGVVTRVSTDASGAQVTGLSTGTPLFSPDGTKVLFVSNSGTLVAGDTNSLNDVFVKDLVTGAVTRVSTTSAGAQAGSGGFNAVWSPDGTRVAFTSADNGLVAGDTNGQIDVFVKDLASGAVTRVSTAAGGAEATGGGVSGTPVFSPDGTKIAFASAATNLVAGDNNGWIDIFVKDLVTGVVTRVSTDSAGAQSNQSSGSPVFSPDGTKVAFLSGATNLVSGDTNASVDIFVKDLVTGAITRVSTDAAGVQANGNSAGIAFSPDGTRIAFSSAASSLVAGDTNSIDDVFVKDLSTGAITRVSTSAVGVQDVGPSNTPVFSPDSTRVAFFNSGVNLVAGDSNGGVDVFIATIGNIGAPTYTENGAGAIVAGTVAVGDRDSANYAGGTFTAALISGSVPGDVLSIASSGGVTGINVVGSSVRFNNVEIGVLTATATSLSVALDADAGDVAVRALAEAVRFSSTSDDPGSGARTVTFTLVDGGGTAGGGADTASFTRTVNVTPTNDAPVLTGVAASITVAENAAPTLLDADITLTDDGNIANGRVTVSGLLAEDRVALRNEGTGAGQIGVSGTSVTYGGVTIGTLSGGTGATFVVALNGAATNAAVDALIQNLTYANASDAPIASRTLRINVIDSTGTGIGNPATFTPLTGASNPFGTFDVGVLSKPTFIDFDNDGDLDLVSGEEFGTLAAFRNNGNGTYTQLIASTNPFNGIDVGIDSTPAAADLDGDGDLDLLVGENDGFLNAYRNNGNGTFFSFSINALSGTDFGTDTAPAFVDFDNDGDLDVVSGETNGTLLAFRNNNNANYTQLTGAANPFNGIDVGTISAPSFLDFDADGDLDLLVGEVNGTALAYRNNGNGTFTNLTGAANPFNGLNAGFDAALAFADLDGDGDLDAVSGGRNGTFLTFRNDATTGVPITVNVTAQNDAPTTANLQGDTVSYTEQVMQTYLDAGLNATIADPDSGNFNGGSLRIQITAGLQAGADAIFFVGNGRVSLSSQSAGATVFVQLASDPSPVAIGTLANDNLFQNDTIINLNSDNATPARVQELLRSISYNGNSDVLTSGQRTITYTVTDGDGGTSTTTSFVNVTGVNDAPGLSIGGGSATFTESASGASTPVLVANGSVFLSDVDNTTLASATVTISANREASDVLAFVNTNSATYGNIAASYNGATGVLTLTSAGATATIAQFQSALRAVTFTSTSDNPSTATRTLSFVVNDGTDNSAVGTRNLNVAAANDSPVITINPVGVLVGDPVQVSTTTPGFPVEPSIALLSDGVMSSHGRPGRTATGPEFNSSATMRRATRRAATFA